MKIFVATPAYGTVFDMYYISSMLDTLNKAKNLGHQLTWYSVSRALLCKARNEIAHAFLESDADVLMSIDSDISWPVVDFFKIVESPHPFIGGNYAKKNGTEFAVDIILNSENNIAEVPVVPTGFLKIDRKVFEDIKEKVKLKPYNQEGHIPFYQVIYKDGFAIQEDQFISQIWKSIGGKCYTDLSVQLKHAGKKMYSRNAKQYFKQKQSEMFSAK